MNRAATQLAGLALLGLLSVTLLLAPIHARAASDATDRHEIPTFVRDRVEIATGAERAG